MVKNRSAPRSFLDRHGNAVLIAVVMVAGWIANYAVLQNRIGNLEVAGLTHVTKTEQDDLTRRVVRLETELVPRAEHLMRDEQLNKRLDSIENEIKAVRDLEEQSIRRSR